MKVVGLLILAAAIATDRAKADASLNAGKPVLATRFVEAFVISRGRSIPTVETSYASSIDHARAIVACVISGNTDIRQSEDVRRLLEAQDLASFKKTAVALHGPMVDCAVKTKLRSLNIAFRISNLGLRGLAADAWFRKNGYPKLKAGRYAQAVNGSDWVAVDARQRVISRMSDCLVTTQPQLAVYLTSTAWGSDEESAALGRLTTFFGSCLEKDAQLSASRAELRIAIASAIDWRFRQPQD